MGKSKIGTEVKKVTAGKARVAGHIYSITEGRTKVNGVTVKIILKKNKEIYTITITRKGSGTSGVPYLEVNGKTYRGSSSEEIILEFEEGTELLFVAAGESSTRSVIYLNDSKIATGDTSGNAARYTMPLERNLEVLLDRGSSYYSRIYITEV